PSPLSSISLSSPSLFSPAPPPPALPPLSLHDALPILGHRLSAFFLPVRLQVCAFEQMRCGLLRPQRVDTRHQPGIQAGGFHQFGDRKSTRLNSSHVSTSYAVFCLKKKKIHTSTAHSRS